MLNRDFDFGSISTITNGLADKFMTNVPPSVSSAFSKAIDGLGLPSNLTSNTATMSNKAAELLNEICSSKSTSRTSADYIAALQRKMNKDGKASVCGSADASIMDKLLLGATSLNASNKSSYKTLLNKAVGSQLSNLGYSGSIPSCLYGKVETMFDKLLNGVNGDLSLKLDLMKYLTDSCMKDSLNSTLNSNLMSKVNSSMLDSLYSSNENATASSFLEKLKLNNLGSTIGMMENNISTANNGTATLTKLNELNSMYVSNNATLPNYVNKSNLAMNLNNDSTAGGSDLMNSMGSIFTSADGSKFKSLTNINDSATSYLATLKSNDSLSSLTKSANVSLASSIKLSNLFG